MTGLVRKAMLLCLGGVLLAGAAMAGIPSPATSVLRPITLLPREATSGNVDPLTTARTGIPTLYCITVNDLTPNPVAFSQVELDFGPCAGADIELCSVQGQTGLTASCGLGLRRVSLTADVNGNACFNIVGNSNNATGSTVVSAPCIKVYADGVLLGDIGYSAYDHEGSLGTDGTDLFLFFQDQGFSAGTCATTPCAIPSTTRARSDYDNNCCIDGTDLFLFFQVQGGLFASGSCTPSADCVP